MLSSMPEPDSSYPNSLSPWFDLDYFRRNRSLLPLGDHFHRRRQPLRLRWGLIGLIVLACVALPVVAHFTGNRRIYQTRPVSEAHAMFNNQCDQCHTRSFETARRLWPANASLATVTDAACKQCHDGPIHHDVAIDPPHCANCHREHRGRALLTDVPDGRCTGCHGDLKRNDGKQSSFANIHGWAVDHPDFRVWTENRRDQAAVKFNHSVHLPKEGIRGPNGKLLQLRCEQCHQEDDRAPMSPFTIRGDDQSPAASFEGGPGRLMRPINYQEHCAACHPLGLQIAGSQGLVIEAPHKAPAIVRAALREDLTHHAQDVQARTPGSGDAIPPLPGRLPGQQVIKEQSDWVSEQLARAERVLFDGPAGCTRCHLVKERRGARGLPKYQTTEIPKRWLEHGAFSHRGHRMVQCASCHEKAQTSKETSDVLLPHADSCRQCHHPPGGARSDCVLCHHYHDRKKESPPAKRDIPDFLH
jgi:hypothetical protein